MPTTDLSEFIREHYVVKEWRHATAILAADFPTEFAEIQGALEDLRLYKSWITDKGKNKSPLAIWVDYQLTKSAWIETKFNTQVKVDENVRDSPTHKVDCYKNRIALEVEWNNKDPFYDRDLNNFRLLFDLNVISVGIILTRADELQGLFDELDKGESYGQSTTHLGKLLPRIEGGGGGGCPLLVFGIKKSLYDENLAPVVPTKTQLKAAQKAIARAEKEAAKVARAVAKDAEKAERAAMKAAENAAKATAKAVENAGKEAKKVSRQTRRVATPLEIESLSDASASD